MRSVAHATRAFFRRTKIEGYIFFLFALYLVIIIKLITFRQLGQNLLFGSYSLAVAFYIISRFVLSIFYESTRSPDTPGQLPTLSFGIPSRNEGENIRKTILQVANCDYPKELFDIVAVNDGSTDNTLSEMQVAQAEAAKLGVRVQVIDFKTNLGKRAGMATCIEKSSSHLIVFIDSDSFVEKNTARELVKYFVDDKVAAVAGHALVANAETNVLTKMQAVRYFVAFRSYKAAEALFGSVTCCSGCCSAYRRQYVLEVLSAWRGQTFLGVPCTYGDDRSLTNHLLKSGYNTLYAPTAVVHTVVPDTYKKFINQQLRWKKSWVRESLIAAKFMWKRHPLMALGFYLGLILPLMAPFIVARALVWYPLAIHRLPYFYLGGLFLMGLVYGLYYYIHTRDGKWVFGVLFATLYTLVLIWQLPYAIFTLRDARWGTR